MFELLVAYPEFPIILRGRSDKFFKLIIEVADIVIAKLHTYFCYGFICRYQKFLRRADSEINQILHRRNSQNFFEVMWETGNAHIRDFTHLRYGNVFSKMFVEKFSAMLKRGVAAVSLKYFLMGNLIRQY